MFANPKQMTTISTGAVPGDQAEPSGQMTAIVELPGIAYGGDQGGGGFGSHPFHLGDPLTGLALLKHLGDSPVKIRDSDVNFTPELVEIGQGFPEGRCETVVRIF